MCTDFETYPRVMGRLQSENPPIYEAISNNPVAFFQMVQSMRNKQENTQARPEVATLTDEEASAI